MDPIGLFTGFSNAIGFEPFFLLIFIGFLVLSLPVANKPLPAAFLIMAFSGLILAKNGILFLFQMWAFELTIIMIGFYIFVKNPNVNGLWFWLGLGLLAFVL